MNEEEKNAIELDIEAKYVDKTEEEFLSNITYAEIINNYDIDEDVCKQIGQKANCNEFEDIEKCIECIKQCFENKVKEIK